MVKCRNRRLIEILQETSGELVDRHENELDAVLQQGTRCRGGIGDVVHHLPKSPSSWEGGKWEQEPTKRA